MLCSFGGIAVILTAPPAWTAESPFAQLHRIAIIAALGDRLEIWAQGWSDRDSHDGFRPIDGKALDNLVTQTATNVISQRFEVVPTVYDSSAFIVPDTDPPSEDLSPIRTLIMGLPPSDVDAYLVIRKRTWHLTPLYLMDGITAHKSALLGSRNLFVTLQVDLVDAKTGVTLSARFLPLMTGISRELWVDTPERMTDEQASGLQQRIADVIVQRLPAALNSMGLSGAHVAP